MELIQGSPYKIVKSASSLFSSMQKYFGLKEKVVRAKLKACGFTAFKAEEWDKYVSCVTQIAPCPFCGAPRQYTANLVTHKRWGALCCVQNRQHYHMEVLEDILAYKLLPVEMRVSKSFKDIGDHNDPEKVVRSSVEYDNARQKAHSEMMRECEHGNLRHACLICISDEVQKRMEN